jgi:integrase
VGGRRNTARRPSRVRPDRTRAAKGSVAQFDPHTFLGPRNQAILALLSDCGVRREELCLIEDADVNLEDLQVRVYAPKTRHSRWRLVPFSEETSSVLANYRRLRERYLARPTRRRAARGDDGARTRARRRLQTECFLISQAAGQLQGDSVAFVLDRLRARLRRQGFDEANLHAHLFRHDYITRKALDGENPRSSSVALLTGGSQWPIATSASLRRSWARTPEAERARGHRPATSAGTWPAAKSSRLEAAIA